MLCYPNMHLLYTYIIHAYIHIYNIIMPACFLAFLVRSQSGCVAGMPLQRGMMRWASPTLADVCLVRSLRCLRMAGARFWRAPRYA